MVHDGECTQMLLLLSSDVTIQEETLDNTIKGENQEGCSSSSTESGNSHSLEEIRQEVDDYYDSEYTTANEGLERETGNPDRTKPATGRSEEESTGQGKHLRKSTRLNRGSRRILTYQKKGQPSIVRYSVLARENDASEES